MSTQKQYFVIEKAVWNFNKNEKTYHLQCVDLLMSEQPLVLNDEVKNGKADENTLF